MSTHPTLSGEFVTLRPLVVADAEITLHWRQSDRAVYLNQGAGSLESQRAWIASSLLTVTCCTPASAVA